MDKDIEKRRSWLWKKKNGFGEGGTSPTTVKIFDEQEVARILEDQVRCQQEQMDCTLREVDEKYSKKEKAINEKLETVNKKLTFALAEVTAKDNLVKQHIKVSEEAVVGWERTEAEAASLKQQRDAAVQQKLAAEDRVQHLDGALKEVMKQLRSGREEQEQRIHEITVKKTQEYDNLRAAMESKLAEASQSLAQTREELMESRAESMAFANALQERSRALAEVTDAKSLAETNSNALQILVSVNSIDSTYQAAKALFLETEVSEERSLKRAVIRKTVRLEGMEKKNASLKYDIRLVTKGLEARTSELEHARKETDEASKQLAESVKKATYLDEECKRLRTLVRKKTPSNGAMARLRQDVDPVGRDSGRSPRRRPSGRSLTVADHVSPQCHEEEDLQSYLVANASAEKIRNLQEEIGTLKEALAKRNDELQCARIMCAKTASRLSSVEEEVEALRLASRAASQMELSSLKNRELNQSRILSESSPKTAPLNRDSLNFELMDDFEEMERLANSQPQSHSVTSSEHTVEAADGMTHQLRVSALEEALAAKDRDLEAANQICHELSTKLAVAEEKLVFLQSKNTASEQSVIDLRSRVDSLLESQELSRKCDEELAFAVQKLVHMTRDFALATGTEFAPTSTSEQLESSPSSMSETVVVPLHWKDRTLDTSMSSLVESANAFLQTGADVFQFILGLTTTLDYILVLHGATLEELRKECDISAQEQLAKAMEVETTRVRISELEEELCRIRAEQENSEMRIQVEMERFSRLEAETLQLKTDKNELENNLSDMDQHLVEANERVESLRVRLSAADALVSELRTQQTAQDNEKEEELIERELLALSSPGHGLVASMRAADVEMHQLHDKVAALESELRGERQRHQEVVSKLEDLQEQIDRGVKRHGNSAAGDLSELAMAEDGATRSARKEKEIAAAALAECQRTIIALGKQLKVLGLQEGPTELQPSDDSPASPDAIEKMTHTMEFLRSQADIKYSAPPIAAQGTSLTWSPRSARPALPGLYSRPSNGNGAGYKNGTSTSANGRLLLSIELPDSSSVLDAPVLASPASPARILRSVRTIRGPNSIKASSNDRNTLSTNSEGAGLESGSGTATSTFRRFYSTNQSETSMSSDNSNPGP